MGGLAFVCPSESVNNQIVFITPYLVHCWS
jgi:hypothetical protein